MISYLPEKNRERLEALITRKQAVITDHQAGLKKLQAALRSASGHNARLSRESRYAQRYFWRRGIRIRLILAWLRLKAILRSYR